MAEGTRNPRDIRNSKDIQPLMRRRLFDITIASSVGAVLVIVAILWALPTGVDQGEGWHTFYAEPGRWVKLEIYTHDDPIEVYIVTSETSMDRNWNYEDPTDYLAKYDIPANSHKTIELHLPEEGYGDDANWGFMFYQERGNVLKTYRQTKPLVMDHLLYTWIPTVTLSILLLVGLGTNHYLRRSELREMEMSEVSDGTMKDS